MTRPSPRDAAWCNARSLWGDGSAGTPVRCGAAPSYLWLKEKLDRYVALAALLGLWPVMLALALFVRRDGHPALFRQRRAGRFGKPFELFKFRTMRPDVDAFGDSPQSGEDPRITPTGRWLRETSLDELPQLINVLQGDMSLVGPRPPIPYEVEEYTTWHRKRLSIRPGVTGLWQTMGRSRRTYNQMVKLDNFYIDHWSLGLDLRILVRTLRVVLRGSDAY